MYAASEVGWIMGWVPNWSGKAEVNKHDIWVVRSEDKVGGFYVKMKVACLV